MKGYQLQKLKRHLNMSQLHGTICELGGTRLPREPGHDMFHAVCWLEH